MGDGAVLGPTTSARRRGLDSNPVCPTPDLPASLASENSDNLLWDGGARQLNFKSSPFFPNMFYFKIT